MCATRLQQRWDMQDKAMMAVAFPALQDISGLEMIHSAAANKANLGQEYLGLIVS